MTTGVSHIASNRQHRLSDQVLANTTHWTGRAMAKAVGISLPSVQRIWQAHQLQPHRIRTFPFARSELCRQLADVVGL